MALKEILEWARRITKIYRAKYDPSHNLTDHEFAKIQIAHATSELGELYDAIDQNQPSQVIAGEAWDGIFAIMSVMDGLEIPIEDILQSFTETQMKLDKRAAK